LLLILLAIDAILRAIDIKFALPFLLVPVLKSHIPFLFPSLGSLRIRKSRNFDTFGAICLKDMTLRVDVGNKAVTVELQRHDIAEASVVVAAVSISSTRDCCYPRVVLRFVFDAPTRGFVNNLYVVFFRITKLFLQGRCTGARRRARRS